jgi:hypothetical protein
MSAKITGRCLCGFIKYTYTGPLGSAGHVKGFIKRGVSGTELTRYFCPECGSPIYTSSPRHPLHVYVKAGTLDDPTVVKPGHQSWVGAAVSWSAIDSSLPTFPRGRV